MKPLDSKYGIVRELGPWYTWLPPAASSNTCRVRHRVSDLQHTPARM